jgi:alpha-beta hydrolase superfamily lysophospholipase
MSSPERNRSSAHGFTGSRFTGSWFAVAAATLVMIAWQLAGPATAAARGVSFRTDDGVTLAGLWYEPVSRAPAVILIHMLHRSRNDWEPLASRLSGEGYGVLAFDLRGHGESGGAIPADGQYTVFLQDVAAARHFVSARTDVVPSRLALIGASIGGNLALLDAAARPGVTAIALLSPSIDYRGLRLDAAIRKFPGLLLLVAGDDDPYAMRSSHEIVKAGGGRRETLVLPHAGHGTTMLSRNPDLIRVLVDWVKRALI